jgi:hypothetical protein
LPNTILLAGAPFTPPEKQASVAITPGMLVEVTPNAATLRPHATAGGNARAAFALESLVPPGSGTTAQIDTVYPIGDTVRWVIANPGDELYALLPANATAVVEGSALVSNGDGTLKLHVAQAIDQAGTGSVNIIDNAIVAYAAEAVNNSAGATVVRVRVHAR